MDNGKTLLDVIDDDFFGGQNDATGQMFNWADEFLGDNEMDISASIAAESGNLATNTPSNILLTSSNYAATSSIPAQTVSIATAPFLQTSSVAGPEQQTTVMPALIGQSVVNPLQNLSGQSGLPAQVVQQGNQQYILKTANGNQIQLSQSQLQQHLLQQQQNSAQPIQQTTNLSTATSSSLMNRPISHSTGGISTVSLGLNQPQFKTSSPGPNVNIVHLPGNIQTQTQQQPQPAQQFQIAPGMFLQIPGGTQNLSNTSIVPGQQTILTGQQGGLMNSQSTVIQNPNVVNVNVATHQAVVCNSPSQQQQQQQQQRLTNLQTATQNPFNIQGTLIQTAEGKSILIPSQNLAQPINIQQLSMAQPQAQTQNPVGNMIQLAQPPANIGSDNSQSQGVQQIVLNNQGQQILVQRAPTPSAPSQNIIVRTTMGQQGLVQINRSGQIQNSGQTLQAVANTGTNQPLKIVQQPTQGQGQTGVPIINIGGQNISLQQLSGQLGNLQGLQVVQQQQNQQQSQLTSQGQGQLLQQGQITLQQIQNSQGQVTLQPQTVLNSTSSHLGQHNRASTPGQSSVVNSQGQLSFHRGQVVMQQNSVGGTSMQSLGGVSMQQQNQMNSQVQIANKVNRAVTVQASQLNTESAKNAQAQLLLQQINRSLNTSNIGDSSPSVQNPPNVNLMVVKQENMGKMQFSDNKMAGDPTSSFVGSSSQPPPNVNLMVVKQEDKPQFPGCSFPNSLFQTNIVKKEPDLIESLVKQEVPCSVVTTAEFSNVTSTVSQSTPMSLFTLGNSDSDLSSSKLSDSGPSFSKNSVTNNSSDLDSNSGGLSIGQNRQSATVQTIHLPPELQHQFQRVQLEMKNVQAAKNITAEQKQSKLKQLQFFQKKILLKGRVLATTRAEPHHIKQSLAALSQTGGPNSSQSLSTALSTSTLQQSGSALLNSSSSQVTASSTTVKDLLKSMASSDRTMTPSSNTSSNTHPQLPGNGNTLGPVGLSFMNSSTSSSQALSALLSTTISTMATPTVTPTNLMSSTTSMTSYVNQPEQAPPPQSRIAALNVNQTEQTPPPQLQSQTAPNVNKSSVPSSSDSSSAAAAAAPEAAVPTQIKIANKVLTLSLTKAQRDKVQSYLDRMTPEQQQQYLQTQQGVLQRIQRQQEINAQVKAQVVAQKKQQALSASQNKAAIPTVPTTIKQPVKLQNSDAQIIKSEVKTIPVPTTNVPVSKPASEATTITRTLLRGQKRNYMDIPKGTLINQQIKQDQNHALNPDTKRPFKSRGDACRRLLRYHVLQSYGPTPDEFEKFDGTLTDIATDLLQKKEKMLDRFRVLLMHETMRCQPSSELVMLQRMQNQDLRKVIEEEKELVKNDPDAFEPMPMKFLKKDKSETEMEGGEEDESSDGDDLNSTLVNQEPDDSDVEEKKMKLKVKKLVIKTDGEKYRSSFKRQSLDSSRSSIDDKVNVSGDSADDTLEHPRISLPSIDDDDEDTNEFGDDRFRSLQEEAEQAALLISSAEESQDSQAEEMEDGFGGLHSRNSSHIAANSVQKSLNVIRSNSNCELTSESVFFDESQSATTINSSQPSVGSYSSTSRLSSVDETGKYVPNHSPVSIASSDNDVIIEGSSDQDKGGHFDKFNMYQPITESLTDSEENSHYSADNSAEQNSIIIDDDDAATNIMKGGWKPASQAKNNVEPEDSSDQESDQEVKAQMESAINSILSLGQSDPPPVYTYSQPNDLYSNASQSSYEYNSASDFTANMNEMSQDNVPSLAEVSPYTDTEANSDLDIAVNSILM